MKLRLAGYWARIALLFLVRSGRSTATLSVMVVTAVAALIFLSALTVGVEDAMLRNTVGLFAGHITGYDLPGGVAAADLRVEGVEAVLKRRYLPGVLAGHGIAQPLALCGIDPEREAGVTALERKLIEGRYPAAGRPEILIGRDLADIFGARTGGVLRFSGDAEAGAVTFAVSGIYQTGLPALDRGIALCPLEVLPVKNDAWSAAVFLDTGVFPESVLEGLRARFSEPARFESWEAQMPDLRQLVDLEALSMVLVMVLVFGVVAIGIACSFVIFIIRNMREYGIMKALGVTPAEMSLLIMSKVAFMNLMACAAGLLIGMLAVWGVALLGGIDLTAFTSHNRYFAVSGIIYPRLTAFSLWAPPAVAVLFSVPAAVWPALLVARKRAADILRML